MSQHKTDPTPHDTSLHNKITERAYQFFEQRGGIHGHDVEDWLRAEREVRAEWARRAASPRARTKPNGRPRAGLDKAA